ncbi:MAG: hypothetical protein QOG68_1799 [Solirubrobacteraceae bacterium]|nr:hypothetical protein [Solirubrobacteraceae bacterium]
MLKPQGLRADVGLVRATRAFVGAFGAGISLAVASSLALLIVSSVIAFRGWPNDLGGSGNPAIARLAQEAAASATAQGRDAAAALSLPAPATARSGAATGTTTRGSSTGRVPADNVGRPSASDSTTSTSSSGATSTPSAPTTSNHHIVTSAAASTLQHVNNAVHGVTKAAANVLAPVAPVVGRTLEQVGAAGPKLLP